MSPRTWAHFAFVRNGTSWLLFKDGTLVSQTTKTVSETYTLLRLMAGNALNAATSAFVVSDVRLVNGIAVWTSNFTPPTPLTYRNSI